MKGEYDESLMWPLNSEITIQLLNWREDKGHVETIIDHYNISIANRTRVMDGEAAPFSGTKGQFIIQSSLPYNANNNTEYLHNDTLCFRVSKVIIHTGNKTYCILYNIDSVHIHVSYIVLYLVQCYYIVYSVISTVIEPIYSST